MQGRKAIRRGGSTFGIDHKPPFRLDANGFLSLPERQRVRSESGCGSVQSRPTMRMPSTRQEHPAASPWYCSIGNEARPNSVLLKTGSTLIRPLRGSDAKTLLELRRRNDHFLRAFEPIKGLDFLTLEAQHREIEGASEASSADRGYSFGVFDSGEKLIGKVSLSNVARGAWQNATLGYFIDKDHNGRGHGTEAVALACVFAFTAADLHRVQAAVMPHNGASARLLVKNGFRFEGLAVAYLRINGRWEDHHVYSLTADAWRREPDRPGS